MGLLASSMVHPLAVAMPPRTAHRARLAVQQCKRQRVHADMGGEHGATRGEANASAHRRCNGSAGNSNGLGWAL